MNKVASYLKNVGKSVGYASIDVAKNLVPEVNDFVDTNKELFKTMYYVTTTSKQYAKDAKKYIANNQLYKDITKGAGNILSDIKTGNFYNASREQESIDAATESMFADDESFADFDNDFGDFNFDDFDDDDDSSSGTTISAGDRVVANSVAKSSNLSAQLISNTVAKSNNMVVKSNLATTNMMMAQNVELMAGLRTSISGLHESVNSILKFATDNVTVQINNESQYFEKTTTIMQENNAILKEMLEMQRNIYKKESEKSKNETDYDKVFFGTTVDLTEYFKVVFKNIKNLDSSGMGEMLTTDMGGQTMIGTMLSNPLGFVMTGLVRSFIPKETAKVLGRFSKTLGSFIPTMISKLNIAKNNDMGFLGVLGNLLGISVETKNKVDTGKYEKGAVPFDGITRKAIVDVIPEHLSRIEALLSGQSQRLYDYNSGKWMSAKDVKGTQDDKYRFFIENGFAEIRDELRFNAQQIRDKNKLNEKDSASFDEDIFKMMESVFKNGGYFSPTDMKQSIKKFKFTNEEIMSQFLEEMSHVNLNKLMQIAPDIMDQKSKYGKYLRDIESSGIDTDRKLYDNSGMIINGIGAINNTGSTRRRNKYNKYDDRFGKTNTTTGNTSRRIQYASSSYKTSDPTNSDSNDYKDYGKIADNSKWKKEMDAIPGDTFTEKFRNAQTMQSKVALIMGSLNDIAKKPASLLTGLITKANQSIYDFLFNSETDMVDEAGKKVKGIFNATMQGMKKAWSDLTKILDEKILTPLEEKYGLKTKFNEFKDKIFGKVQRDEEGNIIKNKYGYKKREGDIFTSTMESIQKNYRSAEKFVKDSLKEVRDDMTGKNDNTNPYEKDTADDPRVARLKELARQDNLTTTELTEAQNLVYELKDEDEKKFKSALSFSEKELLKKMGIKGLRKGGTFKFKGRRLRNPNYKSRTYTATQGGILGDKVISEGEKVKVEPGDSGKNENTEFEDALNGTYAKLKLDKQTFKDIFNEMKGNASDILGKGIVGGGIGLLTGTPLIGAMMGAGLSFIKNSKTVNDLLFGKEVQDEKTGEKIREGGFIPKEIQDTFKKYAPDAGKYGVAGAAASLVLPFGPLVGAVIGAGVGILKNSTTMKDMLFGKEDGLFNEDRQKQIKKYFPKAAAGAIGGLFLGPFGMLGNAALGAGVGLLTETEEFKSLIFGEKDENGDRFGGLKESLDEYFVQPLRDFGVGFKEDFFKFIKTEMVDPLNEAITPLAHEIAYQTKKWVFGIPKFFAKFTKDHIAKPLIGKLDPFLKPISGLVKGVGTFGINTTKKVISAPFKGVQSLGRKATAKQIKRGDTVNMSAAQRIQFRDERGIGDDRFSAVDRDMVQMNEEQITMYTDALNAMQSGDKYFDKEMKKVTTRLGRTISSYLKDGKINGNAAKDARKALQKGDIDGAIKILNDTRNSRIGGKGLSDDDFKTAAEAFRKGGLEYEKIKLRRDQYNQSKDIIRDDFKSKYGINLNDEKVLKGLINNFNEEKKRVATRNEIEKAMEDPTKIVTQGEENIVDAINQFKESVEKMIKGEDILSEDRQAKLDKYGERGNVAIARNLVNRAEVGAARADKAGFKDDVDITSLFNINKELYSTVLKAGRDGAVYNKDIIINLSKLNKKQLKVVKRNPYIAFADLATLKKYTSKARNAKQAEDFNDVMKTGIDIKSIDEADSLMSMDYVERTTRVDYYNRMNALGLVDGTKITKQMILSHNGLKYREMDKLIKDQETFNKQKDVDNIDEAGESAVSEKKLSIFNRVKTVFTEHGPMSYVLKNGTWKKKTSKQNKETQAEADRDNAERTGIMNSLSGLKDGFSKFFKGDKEEDKDKEKKSWWQKILDTDLGKIGKTVISVGGSLFAIGKIKEMWDNEGPDGPMHKIAGKIGQTVGPMFNKIKNWFAGEGEYEGKGLPSFFANDILPNIVNGIGFFIETVVPKAAESIVKAFPSIVTGIVNGVKSILGIGKNKNQDDNKRNISQVEADEKGNATWKGIDLYKKDESGNLVKASAEEIKKGATNFYTEEGVEYSINPETGEMESTAGNTSLSHLDTFAYRAVKSNARAFVKGKNAVSLAKISKNTIGKISFFKNVEKFSLRPGLKAVDTLGSAPGKALSNTKLGKNLLGGAGITNTKIGKSIMSVTEKVTDNKLFKNIIGWIESTLNNIFKASAMKKKVKEGLIEAGKEATEEAVEKAGKKIVEDLVKEVPEKVLKNAGDEAIEKISKKVAGMLSTGGLLTLGMVIADFIWGFDQAKAILGVSHVSFAQRLLSGLVNAINNNLFFGLISTETIVNWMAGPVLAIFGGADDFRKKQAEADKEVEAYNLKHGTNYSKQEYFKNQTVTGKVDNFIDNTVGKFISWINPFDNKNEPQYQTTNNVAQNAAKQAANATKTATTGYLNPNAGYISTMASGMGTMHDNGFVSQLDPKFKNKKFNTGKDSQSQTLGDSGCAPATAANVLNMYAGKGNVMDDASSAALRYKDANSGVTPEYFQNYLGSKGIGTYPTMNKKEMLNGISNGNPTILLGLDPSNKANTPYGAASSHYVLATGLDGRGNVIIQDPESSTPNTLYPMKDVIKQSQLGMITGRGGSLGHMTSKLRSKLGKAGFGRGKYGSDTIEYKVWTRLIGAGLSEVQTAGVMGNIKNESGFRPDAIEKGSGVGFGLIQWSYGRRTAIESYAASIGRSASDIDIQIDFLLAEMTPGGGANGYAKYQFLTTTYEGQRWAKDTFANAQDIITATKAFCYCFERPNERYSHIDRRINDANAYYEAFTGIPGVPYSGSNSYNGITSTDGGSQTTQEPEKETLLGHLTKTASSYYGGLTDKLRKLFTGSDQKNDTMGQPSSITGSTSNGYQAPYITGPVSKGDIKSAQDFYNAHIGKAVDMDGAPASDPVQCVDLFKAYSQEVAGMRPFSLGGSGYSDEIIYRYKQLGLDKYYDQVNLQDAQYGDWLIWKKGSPSKPYSHVGMFTGFDEKGNVNVFGQNQRQKPANVINSPTEGIIGVLRLKDGIAGQGSGKKKSSNTLPMKALNTYRPKMKNPDISGMIERGSANFSGRGTQMMPSMFSNTDSSMASTIANRYNTGVSHDVSNSSTDKLLSIIIDILRIIADNSSKLSEIVTLLSKALDLNLTDSEISGLQSNNAQIKNRLAKALSAQGSSNGMGKAVMDSNTEALASAMYAIARA